MFVAAHARISFDLNCVMDYISASGSLSTNILTEAVISCEKQN